jgi:hypothetical protein
MMLALFRLGVAVPASLWRKKMKKLLLCMVAVLVLGVWAHADIVIGTPNSDNCIPWSCTSITGGTPYQQIYNSSAFSGSINIGTISFYNTYYNNGSQQGIATLDFQMYLAVTSQSVPDGSTPPGEVLFASGHLSDGLWTFGNPLSITGTPFLYDPTKGNLELDIHLSNQSDPSNGIFTYFDAETNGPFSRWCPNCGPNSGYGLVTGFGTAPVPEPGSLVLFSSGLLAVAGTFRRRWMK